MNTKTEMLIAASAAAILFSAPLSSWAKDKKPVPPAPAANAAPSSSTAGAQTTRSQHAIPYHGKISAVDSQADATTRNVQVQATIQNKDHALLPGMFMTVDIVVAAPRKYVTLPQTAVAFNSYGNVVYLVDDTGKDAAGKPRPVARQIFVTTGATRGDQIAVLSGVKDGDVVVTAGQIKLHNGSPVEIDNAVQPTNDPDPKPVDK